jgi:small conductance mechanosensitive channel
MVGREYRRRLKKAFEAENIEFPFPQRTVLMADAKAPLPPAGKPSEGN